MITLKMKSFNLFLQKTLRDVVEYLKQAYATYELNTQISMCEPWEKVVCHVILIAAASLIFYTCFYFLPTYFYVIGRVFKFLLEPIGGEVVTKVDMMPSDW